MTTMPNDFPAAAQPSQIPNDLAQLAISPAIPVISSPISLRIPDLHLRCNFVNHKVDLIVASCARQGGLSKLLTDSIISVLSTLYYSANLPAPSNVRSVTLYLDHMDGVAYTTGSAIDQDHKEIHCSISYFTRPELVKDTNRLDDELRGVLVHELVHCFQYNAQGTAPGGFIEGIADYVRYKAGLSPPHWKEQTRPGTASKWDDGYQHTAFFLLWLDHKHGQRTTTSLNKACDARHWSDHVFEQITDHSLSDLWKGYCADEEWSPY